MINYVTGQISTEPPLSNRSSHFNQWNPFPLQFAWNSLQKLERGWILNCIYRSHDVINAWLIFQKAIELWNKPPSNVRQNHSESVSVFFACAAGLALNAKRRFNETKRNLTSFFCVHIITWMEQRLQTYKNSIIMKGKMRKTTRIVSSIPMYLTFLLLFASLFFCAKVMSAKATLRRNV